MKQITIYELLPRLNKGYVAMDEHKRWWYARTKLKPIKELGIWITYHPYSDASCLSEVYDIEPFDGDWKDSLMECGNHIADASKKVSATATDAILKNKTI